MTHQEKENFISLITTLVVTIPYIAFILGKYQAETFSTTEELKFWATAILILIPIRIVTQIVIYILYSIGRAIVTGDDKEETLLVDERDAMIELKGERIGYYVFLLGFIIAIASLATGGSIAIFFGLLWITGFTSELTTIFSKMYLDKRGL